MILGGEVFFPKCEVVSIEATHGRDHRHPSTKQDAHSEPHQGSPEFCGTYPGCHAVILENLGVLLTQSYYVDLPRQGICRCFFAQARVSSGSQPWSSFGGTQAAAQPVSHHGIPYLGIQTGTNSL